MASVKFIVALLWLLLLLRGAGAHADGDDNSAFGKAEAAAAATTSVTNMSPSVPVPWKNCGSSSDLLHIDMLNASTWPPVHGQKMVIELKAVVAQAIPDALYHVTVKMASIVLLDKQGKLSEIKQVKLPIPAGPINENITLDVPKEVPAGITVDVHVQLVSTASTPAPQPRILCADLTVPFKIVPRSNVLIAGQRLPAAANTERTREAKT